MWETEEHLFNLEYEELVAREIEERRNSLIKYASKILWSEYPEALLELICAAHSWDIPEASFFINKLDINEKDIACMQQDSERYKQILSEEYAESKLANDEAYG